MPRLIRFLLTTLALLPAPLALAQYTTVSGSKVQSGSGVPLSQGMVCFTPTNSIGTTIPITPSGGTPTTGPFCTAIIAGAFNATGVVPDLSTSSPVGAKYQVVVYNQTANTVLLVNWITNVTGPSWSFDTNLTVPISLNSAAAASGLGAPYFGCTAGATYARTDGDPTRSTWLCKINNGYYNWFQQGNQPAPGPNQTATIPVVAQMIADAIANLGPGGGGTPAGLPQEFNAKLTTSTFQGTGMFGVSDKSLITTAVPAFNRYSRNAIQSTYCGGRSCANISWFNRDVPLLNYAGNNTGWGQGFSTYEKGLYTGLGIFDGYGSSNGSTTDPFGGGVLHAHYSDMVFHTPSISQFMGGTMYFSKPYDDAVLYFYHHNHGGNWDGGGEGHTPFRLNGGNYYLYQSGFQVSGTPGAGATTISTLQLYGPDDIFVGGFVYNSSSTPIAIGNVTNYDAVNHNLTVTTGTVTPPTTSGVSTTAISPGPVEGNANGFSQAMTVHVNSGSAYTISVSNPVLAVCVNDRVEIVVPTAVSAIDGSGNLTLTAVWEHGHPAGCEVVQGGTWGVLDLTGDRIGNNWKTSYFVYGASDSSHIKEATYLTGGRGFINPSRHNFGGGQSHVTNATFTRAANVVTVCGMGQSDYGFAGQYVTVSNASPSDFNGTYLLSTFDVNFCGTYSSAGANGTATGAVIDTGGAVNPSTGLGLGGFNIWSTARVKQLGTVNTASNGVTTNGYNGTVYLSPNNLNLANGNNVFVLDDMQNKTETISTLGYYDTPPHNGNNNWVNINAVGKGVMGAGFRFINVTNSEPWTSYPGGSTNGTMPGPVMVNITGPSAVGINFDAPVPRGKFLWIHSNPRWGTGNNVLSPIFVDGISGGGGGLNLQYTPETGTTILSSGKGNGIASALTMTPTTLTFGATGGITFLYPVTFSSATFTTLSSPCTGTACSFGNTTFTGTITNPNYAGTGNRFVYVTPSGQVNATNTPVGVTLTGSSCTITKIDLGIITAATCVP